MLCTSRTGDNTMNKKAYEAPDMVKRMVAMTSIATESADDNVEDDVDWT